MSIKQFEVAAKPKEENVGVQFRLPDHVAPGQKQTFSDLTAYQPDEAQFAVLMATTGRGASDSDRVAGFVNFFVNILDTDGADYLTGRLLDRNDPFGIANVEEIMDFLTEEWTGNPTQGSSGSTPSPQSDGQNSTANSLL